LQGKGNLLIAKPRLLHRQAPFNQSLTGKLSFKLVQFSQCRPMV
jgi:hypothetical protein